MERYSGERGQAYYELAISMSFVLGSLMFVLAVSRYGALNERTEAALRYDALIAQGQDPFDHASLNSVYQALSNNVQSANLNPTSCVLPDTKSLSGSGPYQGAAAALFWNPQGNLKSTCSHEMTTFGNSSTSASNLLVEQFDYTISANAGGYSSWMSDQSGQTTAHTVSATLHTFTGPSLPIILQCYTNIGTTLSASVYPPAISPNDSPAVAPLTDAQVIAAQNNIPVTPTQCQNFVQVKGPYTVTSTPVPSAPPPAPTPTPVPAKTAAPTAAPATAAPSAAPPTPTPAPQQTVTSTSGGGGGGGGGSATAAPSSGPTAKATTAPATTAPTAAPTSTSTGSGSINAGGAGSIQL